MVAQQFAVLRCPHRWHLRPHQAPVGRHRPIPVARTQPGGQVKVLRHMLRGVATRVLLFSLSSFYTVGASQNFHAGVWNLVKVNGSAAPTLTRECLYLRFYGAGGVDPKSYMLRRMEVEFISHDGPPFREGAQQVYALHGPDASMELSMLRALMQLKEAALPILPALLGQPPAQAR